MPLINQTVNFSPLHKAVIDNDLKAFNIALETHHPDVVTKKGVTPVHLAVALDRPELLRTLKDKGADLKKIHATTGYSPAFMAHRLDKHHKELRKQSGIKGHRLNREFFNTEEHLLSETPAGKSSILELLISSSRKKIPTYLIDNVKDFNRQNSRGQTLLMLAVGADRADLVKQILERPEIDLTLTDKKGNNLFHYLKSPEILEILVQKLREQGSIYLFNHPNKEGLRPLHSLFLRDSALSLAFSDNYRISINTKTEDNRSLAFFVRTVNDVKELSKRKLNFKKRSRSGEGPLTSALRRACGYKVIKELFQAEADPYHDGQKKNVSNPYHFARNAKVARLIELNDLRSSLHNVEDEERMTPIMRMAQRGDHDAIKVLVHIYDLKTESGREDGLTALHFAKDAKTARVLMQRFYVDIKDSMGRTPAMIAALDSNYSVIAALLKNGADPTLKDKGGKSLFDYVAKDPKLKALVEKAYNKKLDQEPVQIMNVKKPYHPKIKGKAELIRLIAKRKAKGKTNN